MITTTALPAASGRSRLITLWVLSGLVTLLFMAAGGAKLAGAAVMVELFAKVGLGQWLHAAAERRSAAYDRHQGVSSSNSVISPTMTGW